MAEIVGGISVSHAPGWLGWPDAPPAVQRASIAAFTQEIVDYLDEIRPDVIVAILDDHFENLYRNLMPTFAIGIADAHAGPADYWLGALGLKEKLNIPSDPELARELLGHLLGNGFDIARMGPIEYGNNLIVPWHFIRLRNDLPVVPIFINVFSPPLPSVARAYALGEALAKAVRANTSDKRVAFLATGGLSHWPPVWMEHTEESDPFLDRMRRFQTEGRPILEADPNLMVDLAAYEIEMARTANRPLVNAEWDRRFLDALGRGDVQAVKAYGYDEVEREAGHGGHEILNWAAVMGAMGGRPAKIVGYEPVTEWICGMAYATYPTAA
ncbi:MAG TPA: extradiol dioxygenase [Alphaproteobacteria bacterium]|jgi:2,3-dihydroxyphenylpropionate 1,2-dioxygenase|nr:extradiol dioxygenase [Alphaproteobacteria bacterium]